MTASPDSNPWAWLGLLKWSLSYTDGTTDATSNTMSDEDREFLEAVMKEGIIDENERMKEILQQVAAHLDKVKTGDRIQEEEQGSVDDLLQELQDIVEQIDYARAFAAMKGLNFLLGCVQEKMVPVGTKIGCLGCIATLCQNNPHVQKEFLELGSIRVLSDLFFSIDSSEATLQAKIMQAISANVRSFDLAETVFVQLEQSPALMEQGLLSGSVALRKRTLFFLRALLSSDNSDAARVVRFTNAIRTCIEQMVLGGSNQELVEMALSLLVQLLESKSGVGIVLSKKSALVGVAVPRVTALRSMSGDDAEIHSIELELWESLIQLLARTSPQTEVLQQ